jgi:hypothetical protein
MDVMGVPLQAAGSGWLKTVSEGKSRSLLAGLDADACGKICGMP